MPSRSESPRFVLIRFGLVLALCLTAKFWFPWFMRGAMFFGEMLGRQVVAGLPKQGNPPAKAAPTKAASQM